MEFTAQQIAMMINGSVDGNPEAKVNSVAKIEEGKEGDISFLANPKYTEFIYDCGSSIVIVGNDFIPTKEVKPTLIKVDNPYECFALLLQKYQEMKSKRSGIEEPIYKSPSASIGEEPYIGAFARIGDNSKIGNNAQIHSNVSIGNNVVIGNNAIIYPNVSIYDDCIIGNNCTIHSGSVIGSDGFGFAPNSENNYNKIPQIGNVVIEDHVEIGANTVIDRATMGSTVIKKGVKLDNLIQIAHNVEIGENTVMAAHTGVSGSTKLGKNCMVGGQVGFAGHLTIAEGTKIGAQSGIGKSIKKENTIIMGSPAINIGDFQRSYVGFKNLPKIQRVLNNLEKEVSKLTDKE